MQFTGTQLSVKRNFYTQNTNFLWSGDLFIDNPATSYELGVSGADGTFSFVLQSGKITQNGAFLHHCYPFEQMALQCEMTTSGYNFLKDGTPLVFGTQRPSGNFDYIFFNRSSLVGNSNFNLYVEGSNAPSYSISPVGYLISSGQNVVTGTFANSGSYPIRAFGSNAIGTQRLMFNPVSGTINPGAAGTFNFSGDFTDFNFGNSIITNFYTNFGDLLLSFSIVDARTFNRFIMLQTLPSAAFDPNNSMNRTLNYTNYSGGFVSTGFNAGLSFALEYVSGSGSFPYPNGSFTAPYLTTGYGNFSISGLLTGAYVVSITDPITELPGLYSGFGTGFAWATGAVFGLFSGFASGFATGIGYSGFATGLFSGQVSDFILNGSGILLYSNGFTTGLATNVSGSLVPVGPFTGNVSLAITGSGSYSGPLTGTASGASSYIKTFTGAWDLLTGINVGSLVSLKRPGNFSSMAISGSGLFAPNSSINFQINANPDIFGNPNGARLTISGGEVLNPIVQFLTL